MATTKQINELDRAVTINDSDILAVAQADKTEAQGVPVSALTEKVAQDLTNGALSELAFDVSLGKKMLAKTLTSKGAQNISAKSTLLQMNDALNNLPVAGERNLVVGTLTRDVERVDFSGFGYWAQNFLVGGDRIVFTQGTLYYVPYGEYDSLGDMLAAATHTEALTVGTSYIQTVSLRTNPQETLLAVSPDANTFKIYSVNVAAKTFAFVKDVDISAVPRYDAGARARDGSVHCISDDGKFILYQKETSVVAVVNTETGTVKTITVENYYGWVASMFIDGDCRQALIMRDSCTHKVTITETDDDFALSYLNMAYLNTTNMVPCLPLKRLVSVSFDTFNDRERNAPLTITVKLYNPVKQSFEGEFSFQYVRNRAYRNGSDVSIRVPGLQTPILKALGENTYQYITPWDTKNQIEVDSQTGMFTVKKLSPFGLVINGTSSYYWRDEYLYHKGQKVACLNRHKDNLNEVGLAAAPCTGLSYGYVFDLAADKVLCLNRNVGGKTVCMGNEHAFAKGDIDAGVYDVAVPAVQLQADGKEA